jgi:hypothetical protein
MLDLFRPYEKLSIKRQIQKILSEFDLSEYCRACTEIDFSAKDPLLDYIAFNFLDDQIENIKFYYTFYNWPDSRTGNFMLPRWDEFALELPQWRAHPPTSGINTGMSIAAKISHKAEPAFQFHIRYPTSSSIADIKGLSELPKKNYFCGVAYEYQGKAIDHKKYVYIDELRDLAMLCKKFGEKSMPRHMLEYSCNQKSEKIIYWSTFDHMAKVIQSSEWPNLIEFNWMMQYEFPVNTFHTGVYLGGRKRSIYFQAAREKLKPGDTDYRLSLDFIKKAKRW